MFLRTTIPVPAGPVTRAAALLAFGAAAVAPFSTGPGFLNTWLTGSQGWGSVALCFLAGWWTLVVGAPLEFRLGRVCLAAFFGAAAVLAAWLAAVGIGLGLPTVWFSVLVGVQLGVIPWARVLTVAPFFRYFWPIAEAPGMLVAVIWCILVALLADGPARTSLALTISLIVAGFVAGRICERGCATGGRSG